MKLGVKRAVRRNGVVARMPMMGRSMNALEFLSDHKPQQYPPRYTPRDPTTLMISKLAMEKVLMSPGKACSMKMARKAR